MIYRVFNIDYDIEEEDIEMTWDDFDNMDFDDFIEEKMNEILEELPKELRIELDECDDEDIEDELADCISNETGWLVNSFNYEKVGA